MDKTSLNGVRAHTLRVRYERVPGGSGMLVTYMVSYDKDIEQQLTRAMRLGCGVGVRGPNEDTARTLTLLDVTITPASVVLGEVSWISFKVWDPDPAT
jgi:hypothetical protein